MASAPSLGQVLRSSTSGVGLFSFHTPDFHLFLLCTGCFNKGKNLQHPMGPRTPWPWAARCPRPLHQKRALTLLQFCPDGDQPPSHPVPPSSTALRPRSACRRGRVPARAAHSWPGPGPLLLLCWCHDPLVRSWVTLGLPTCAAAAGHHPFPPSLGCLAAPFGQRGSRRDLHVV